MDKDAEVLAAFSWLTSSPPRPRPVPERCQNKYFPLLFLPGEASGPLPSAGPQGGETHSPPEAIPWCHVQVLVTLWRKGLVKRILNRFMISSKRIKIHNTPSITARPFYTEQHCRRSWRLSRPLGGVHHTRPPRRRLCSRSSTSRRSVLSWLRGTEPCPGLRAAAPLCREVGRNIGTAARGAGGTDALVASHRFVYGCREGCAPRIGKQIPLDPGRTQRK